MSKTMPIAAFFAALLIISLVSAQMVDVYYITLSVDGKNVAVIDKKLASDYPRQYTGDYSYDVLDANGAVLSTSRLDIPDGTVYERFYPNGSIDGEFHAFKGELTLIVPASSEGKTVLFKDPTGTDIAKIDVSGLKSTSNQDEITPENYSGVGLFTRYMWIVYILIVILVLAAIIVLIVKLIRRRKRKKNSKQ